MLFGISSAPEVFRGWIHELIKGLAGTEVVVDDFVVAGFGETYEEAVCGRYGALLPLFIAVPSVGLSLQ